MLLLKIAFLSLFFLFSTPAHAALSLEAKSYLEKVPDQKITAPFVVQVAIENSDAFQILGLQNATVGLEEMATLSPLTDTYLVGGSQYSDDNSVKPNPFQPQRAKRWEWNLGLQKQWETGTKTQVSWAYDTNRLEFELPPGLANGFLTNYKQSVASLQLEQPLLKNSFGTDFRSKLKAVRNRAQSIRWKTRDDVENLTLNFVEEFYNAWLSQQQVISLESQVKRQERLVSVLKTRHDKGAIESPEFIQFEALLAQTRTRLSQARSMLSTQWESLVIGLKLPENFLSENPLDIPTELDEPHLAAQKLCQGEKPTKTSAIHALEKNLEALDHEFKASRGESLPDLKLIAGYRGNSIGDRASLTPSNVLLGRDLDGYGLGPAWNVGVQLNWSLDNSAAKAQRAKTYIEKEQTAARLRIAVDQVKSQWRDLCRRLNVELKNETLYRNVVKEQTRRVQAESKRFGLGRSRVDQLVATEDDLSLWTLQNQQKTIEVRQLSWQIYKLSGELYRRLEPLFASSNLKDESHE